MNPEASRRRLNHAVRNGVLTRPEKCERCGVVPPNTSDGRAAIQGHHHDYSLPLDVEWICAKCHRAETPLPEVIGAPTLGERNGQAKLTPELVVLARRMRARGMIYREIADLLGVDKKTAMRAIKGQQWAHVALAAAPRHEPDDALRGDKA